MAFTRDFEETIKARGQNTAHAAVLAIILAIVPVIGDQATDVGTDDQRPVQQMAEQR